jgi:hypothetical protein
MSHSASHQSSAAAGTPASPSPPSSAAGGSGAPALTEAEAEIYDRQIRLWGVAAQTRMRASRVLLSGLSGLGAEVAKNIVLAGMNVVLADAATVAEEHLAAQFFLTQEDVGKNVSDGGGGGDRG